MKVSEGNKGRFIVHNNTCILEAYECNKEANSGCNGASQLKRHCFNHFVAHAGNGEQNEEKSFQENSSQSKLPTITHAQHNGINEKSTQSHGWSKSKRKLGIQSHDESCNNGGKNSCREQCACIHSRLTQQCRLYSQNIRHSQKRSDTANDFILDVH